MTGQDAERQAKELTADGKKLGCTQFDVLVALIRHGSFRTRGVSWCWTSFNATVKYLDKLVQYGYAKKVPDGSGWTYYPLTLRE